MALGTPKMKEALNIPVKFTPLNSRTPYFYMNKPALFKETYLNI